ncbi:MAG TPA: TIGR02757 family protein [Ignavibacteriaceae bacterium]|nr:TIGR02757 family protein [Ignavibacteriaceae bacterium]
MNLKARLDYHYNLFDKSRISPDPLEFLHRYSDKRDIEIVGFIASVFAYGNIKQIMRICELLFSGLGKSPYNTIKNYKAKSGRIPKGIKHRFYSESDIEVFLSLLSIVIKKYGSLEALFMEGYIEGDKNVKRAISVFSGALLSETEKKYGLTPGIKFMFPLPEKGSACKRMNLFLRWMVRKDELDFGLWSNVSIEKLIIPVDTHIAKICRTLRLTKRKNTGWQMAEEITERLKRYDPKDPVKYDFALCHIGMRKMEF